MFLWLVMILVGLMKLKKRELILSIFLFLDRELIFFNELKTLKDFYFLYKAVSPDVVHHITLKPVIYGSVISRLVKIKGTLNAISGLGYNFTGERKGVVQRLMINLLKFGFNQKNISIIFQNKDDFSELKSLGILDDGTKVKFIKGSGVDLRKFTHSEFPIKGRIKNFISFQDVVG